MHTPAPFCDHEGLQDGARIWGLQGRAPGTRLPLGGQGRPLVVGVEEQRLGVVAGSEGCMQRQGPGLGLLCLGPTPTLPRGLH